MPYHMLFEWTPFPEKERAACIKGKNRVKATAQALFPQPRRNSFVPIVKPEDNPICWTAVNQCAYTARAIQEPFALFIRRFNRGRTCRAIQTDRHKKMTKGRTIPTSADGLAIGGERENGERYGFGCDAYVRNERTCGSSGSGSEAWQKYFEIAEWI